jgi:hypothetical protein
MRRVRTSCCFVLLAACAGDAGRVVVRVPVSAGEGAVRDAVAGNAPAVLVALDASALALARRAAPDIRVVAIGDEPATDAARAALETIVVEDSGAAAAIELALLAANGIPLPPKVQLGVRTLTAADRAAGGTLRPGPGDVGLALLRQQHAAAVTTTPAVDVVFPFALLQLRGADAERVRDELVAVAKRYPQVALRCLEPAADAQALGTLAQRAVHDGARVLLVAAPDAPLTAVVAAAAGATDARTAVIALDADGDAPGATCVVGQDPALLGGAAAEAARAAVSAGATAVVVHGDRARPVVAARLDAFERALAARPAK